tara:strand:+ start:1209 stop:2111 length:903 start_codon:yes stop_codon:yes gene_type:complete
MRKKSNILYKLTSQLLFFCMSFSIPYKVIGNECNPVNDPSRVTVAGGSITEIMYMIDAEDSIIAVDLTSNFPERARNHPQIGYVRALSAEGILSLDPTLIIGENDMGPPAVLEQINRTGVEIVIVPEDHSVKGVKSKVECVAKILNKDIEAQQLFSDKLDPAIEKLSKASEKVSEKGTKAIFILGLQSGSPLIGGMETSANGLIKMIGAENVLSSFEGWKPVGTESILMAEPDVILISKRGLSSFGDIEALRKHPALALTPAAKNNNIIAMDGMAMLGFGPRTIFSALNIANDILDIDDK